MTFLYTDSDGFLCKDKEQLSPKNYSINAGGQTWEQWDHSMIVRHKGVIKEISWKDLWNTMYLVRLVPNRIQEINNNTDMSPWFIDVMYSVLSRYSWYDEINNTSYQYIPKLSWPSLTEKLDTLDLFSQRWWTTILDEKKWRFILHKKEISDHKSEYVLAEFFALSFLFGKSTIKKNILNWHKIQIPVLRYDIVEKVNGIVEKLRSYGFVVNLIYTIEQHTITLTTNDYMMLAYIRILIGEKTDVILIDKVLEIQQEIFIQYGISPEQKKMRRQLYEVKR